MDTGRIEEVANAVQVEHVAGTTSPFTEKPPFWLPKRYSTRWKNARTAGKSSLRDMAEVGM